jgi:hypothetical protein
MWTHVAAICLSGMEAVLRADISALLSDIGCLKDNFFRRIAAATLSSEADANSRVAEACRKTALATKVRNTIMPEAHRAKLQVLDLECRELKNRRMRADVAFAEARVKEIQRRQKGIRIRERKRRSAALGKRGPVISATQKTI